MLESTEKTSASPIGRREALSRLSSLLLCALAACTRRRYERDGFEFKLGPYGDFLYRKVGLRKRAIVLFRDERGWSALSTRCTYNGCDLSDHDSYFLCPCCRSVYDPFGRKISGPAPGDLPWMGIRFVRGEIYVNPSPARRAAPGDRFTTEELEREIAQRGIQIGELTLKDDVYIPKILDDIAKSRTDSRAASGVVDKMPHSMIESQMIR